MNLLETVIDTSEMTDSENCWGERDFWYVLASPFLFICLSPFFASCARALIN
jgi:hypothetical protein